MVTHGRRTQVCEGAPTARRKAAIDASHQPMRLAYGEPRREADVAGCRLIRARSSPVKNDGHRCSYQYVMPADS
ncbi:hypothetical protein D3C80_1330870 [compost metagenome]